MVLKGMNLFLISRVGINMNMVENIGHHIELFIAEILKTYLWQVGVLVFRRQVLVQ